jgi:hypothetical protein
MISDNLEGGPTGHHPNQGAMDEYPTETMRRAPQPSGQRLTMPTNGLQWGRT